MAVWPALPIGLCFYYRKHSKLCNTIIIFFKACYFSAMNLRVDKSISPVSHIFDFSIIIIDHFVVGL